MSKRLLFLCIPILAVIVTGLLLVQTTLASASGGDTCYATPDDGTTVFSGTTLQIVRSAVNAASAGATVKIAGQCTGGPIFQRPLVDKALTLAGGYTSTDWSNPSEGKETILDGANNGRVMGIMSATVTLRDLTIRNGSANLGAGIAVQDSGLTLDNVQVVQNAASDSGGGIYAIDSMLIITNSSGINGNQATNNGGGLFFDNTNAGTRGLSFSSGIFAYNSTLSNNMAQGNGGAIYIEYAQQFARGLGFGGGVFGRNTTLNNNMTLGNGGGVYMEVDGGSARGLSFGGVIFGQSMTWTNNQAQDKGGGLYLATTSGATARGIGGGAGWLSFGSRWEGNSANEGGAIYLTDVEYVDVESGTMVSNTATLDGGALAAVNTTIPLSATLTGFTITHNTAGQHGGGIFGRSTDPEDTTWLLTTAGQRTVPIYEGLFFANSAGGSGGGFYVEDAARVRIGDGVGMLGNHADGDGGGIYATRFARAVWDIYLGAADFSDNDALNGGAFAINDADTFTSQNSTFTNNDALNDGGAGWIKHSTNRPTRGFGGAGGWLSFGAFSGNSAANGGAVFITGTIGTTDTLRIDSGTTITNNTATGSGGGVYAHGVTTNIDSAILTGNRADNGAALYNAGGDMTLNFSIVNSHTVTSSGTIVNAGGELAVTQSVVKDNAAGVDAGALLNVGGSAEIVRSLIRNNSAINGGGIVNISEHPAVSVLGATIDKLTVSNSTLVGNSADFGAAIYNANNSTVRNTVTNTVVLANSTLMNNIAGKDGGGIFNGGIGGLARVEVIQSTVADNEAAKGGGVFNQQSGGGSAEIYLANSVNTNTRGNDCTNSGGTFTSNNHNADSDNSCNVAINGNVQLRRNVESVATFMLPGGHTLDVLPPASESIVVGEGDPATCQSELVGGIDQLGYFRPNDSCDLGSIDTNATTVPTAVVVSQDAAHRTTSARVLPVVLSLMLATGVVLWAICASNAQKG